MQLEKQVVSLELAKKLKELGVKQESLFYWRLDYHTSEKFDKGVSLGKEGVFGDEFHLHFYPHPRFTTADIKWNERDMAKLDETEISAFTVAELGEMLPKKIEQVIKGGISRTGFWLNIGFDETSNKWRYRYCNHKVNECIEMFFEATEADARAKMLIYLLENNLIALEDNK